LQDHIIRTRALISDALSISKVVRRGRLVSCSITM
jgi:hypothetical protein